MVARRPLATPPEVAEHCRVSEKTLANWRYLSIGPKWIKLGGRDVRYRWDDVDAWLDAHAKVSA